MEAPLIQLAASRADPSLTSGAQSLEHPLVVGRPGSQRRELAVSTRRANTSGLPVAEKQTGSVSEAFAGRHGLDGGVRIFAQSMSTDSEATFSGSAIELVGRTMGATAAQQVYGAAALGPEDLDVVELHDCFTSNEVIAYEALGLTPEGTAERFIPRRRQHLRRTRVTTRA